MNGSEQQTGKVSGRFVEEMELLGNRLFTIAVPADADSEFKAYVFAAANAYALGNRSVDNLLRRHCDSWVKRFEQERIARATSSDGIRRTIVSLAGRRCLELSDLDLSIDCPAGTVAAANSLIRLESTFRAASQLIRIGFAFESEAVIRLGLEQVAWAFGVRNFVSQDEVDATDGTGWLTQLKTVFPGAGRVYGRLSNLAHLAPTTRDRFIFQRDAETKIRINAPEAARESLLLLLILLDAYLVVSELCLVGEGLTVENIDIPILRPRQERAATSIIQSFSSKLAPGADEVFREWWT